DGNLDPGDGCEPTCKIGPVCANAGGGPLGAENGTGMGVMYCYEPGDSTETRARKACESHFGVGQCCVITGGYQNQQYGQCNGGGGPGTVHFHYDAHPGDAYCAPYYVVGSVVSPGWCGAIIGNFLD